MHRAKRKRIFIMLGLMVTLLLMTVGYAAFQSQLDVSGNTTITSNWDIKITNVTSGVPTGGAKNTVAPTWQDLSANMEADLFAAGDAMDYDVTIKNNGTIDAKLEDITKNLTNSNDAVVITFSGYTKGEKLYKGESKVIHVKIAYNPEYTGGETSGETKITFNYVQAEGGSVDPDVPSYLITYNCTENGGAACTDNNEYLDSGQSVNLSKTGTRDGYSLTGWTTDINSKAKINSLTVTNADIQLYAIFEKEFTVTYAKGPNVTSNQKDSDKCKIYNKETSCTVTLPQIQPASGFDVLGWYDGDTKVGNVGDTYTVSSNKTLTSKVKAKEAVMKSWGSSATTDFHSSTYKTNITSVEVLDSINIPQDAVESWDVSKDSNGSVMAYVINDPNNSGKYKLYIAGEGGVSANPDSSYLFDGFSGLTSVNLSKLNTSNVTAMNSMFYNCSGLTSLDLSDFNTSKVTSMLNMFRGCSGLTSLNLSGFDTSNVTIMAGMFQSCRNLTSLDLSNFNTSNVTNMNFMFYYCSGLTSLNLSSFNTSKVTGMSYMFDGCSSLTSLDLSNFNTSKVTNMSDMFYSCTNLTTIYASDSFDTSAVTSSNYMFTNDTKLVGGNGTVFDSSYVDKTRAKIDKEGQEGYFTDKSLPIIDNVSTSSTFNTITLSVTAHMVDPNESITKYEYKIDDGPYIESTASHTFNNLNPNTTYNITIRVTGSTGKTVTQTVTEKTKAEPIMKSWTSSATTDFHSSTYKTNITSVEVLDSINIPQDAVESWDVSKDSDGSVMAYVINDPNNSGKYKLYIAGDGGVKANPDSSYVFYGFSGLTSANLSKLNTSDVTNMSYMFQRCSQLTSVNLSGFNTSKVTTLHSMFASCPKLTSADLSSFDTSNVTIMTSLFDYDSGLVTIDLSSFNTSKVTSMNYMFYGNTSLTTIYASDSFDTTKVTSSSGMFTNDSKLIGGVGTIYNASYVDKTRAKVDKEGQEGYFTDKSLPIIDNVSTSTTTNAITLAVTAHMADPNESITKYEYSIDDGAYVEGTTTHTFSNLDHNTSHVIKLRVTGSTGSVLIRTVRNDYCAAKEGQTYTYSTASSYSTFNPTCRGTYTLEAWGAQGGGSSTRPGGKGAYTKGEILLNSGEKIYVYVGGEGPHVEQLTNVGGYNGGGYSGNNSGSNSYGGGGATDFRLVSGTWNNVDSLKSRIMVAAGGGGNVATTNGSTVPGYGGALTGGSATGSYNATKPTGGTQTGSGASQDGTRGGSFGYAQQAISGGWGGGGGSGYYGGSSGFGYAGAGGSSFISGHSGCNAIASNSSITHTGQANHFSGYKFTNTVMKAGNQSMPSTSGGTETGHSGGGYAKITLGSKDTNIPTQKIKTPTFSESGTSSKTVTITYPAGCGSTLTCTYVKNEESAVTVSSTTRSVSFTEGGTIIATVTDGISTVSNSYTARYYSVGKRTNSTVGQTVTPSATIASRGDTVTFTVPSVSGYTYQGAQIKNSSGTVLQTLNSSTKSFVMPNTNVYIAPIFKYNDKQVLLQNSRDTTFSQIKTDGGVLSFAELPSGWWKGYYWVASNNTYNYRGQAASAKNYNVSKYCKMSFTYSGSLYSSTSGGSRTLSFGLLRDKNNWVHYAPSPDYHKEVSVPMATLNDTVASIDLNPSVSGNNNYYIVIQYLSKLTNSTFNFWNLYFTGCTYNA